MAGWLSNQGYLMERSEIQMIEIETTTKIVATIGGKKRTLRRFKVPVIIPADIETHIKSYFPDVTNEALCEERTPYAWVDFIQNIPDISRGQRGWIASIIWYAFGGEGDTELHEYYKTFENETEQFHGSIDEIIAILDKHGVSKKTNYLAADREKIRDAKLKELIEEVSHYVTG